MRRPLALLAVGSLAFWLVVAYPAFRLWGEAALVYSTIAACLCLVPSVIALVWAYHVAKKSPRNQVLVVMGGTGVRMAFVLGIGILLYAGMPYLQQPAFWLWVLVFYLLNLGLSLILGPTPHGRSRMRSMGKGNLGTGA